MTVTTCQHLVSLSSASFPTPTTPGACEDCLREGTRWVALRLCRECGHVGCCDSSPGRHATRHFHATGHPVIRSITPPCHTGRGVTAEVTGNSLAQRRRARGESSPSASKPLPEPTVPLSGAVSDRLVPDGAIGWPKTRAARPRPSLLAVILNPRDARQVTLREKDKGLTHVGFLRRFTGEDICCRGNRRRWAVR